VTQDSTRSLSSIASLANRSKPQRYGARIGSAADITLSHNLWIDNQSHNPRARGAIQYINNVVYNWGVAGWWAAIPPPTINSMSIGNYFIKGPSSNDRFAASSPPPTTFTRLATTVESRAGGAAQRPARRRADFRRCRRGARTFVAQTAAPPAVLVTMDTAEDAYRKIVAGAGCFAPSRFGRYATYRGPRLAEPERADHSRRSHRPRHRRDQRRPTPVSNGEAMAFPTTGKPRTVWTRRIRKPPGATTIANGYNNLEDYFERTRRPMARPAEPA